MGDWQPGEVRTFYFRNMFVPPTLTSRIKCLPFRDANHGIVCANFTKSTSDRYMVAMQLRNNAGYAINTWHMPNGVRMGIQVGP